MTDKPTDKIADKERIPFENLEGCRIDSWALPSMQGRNPRIGKKPPIDKNVKIEDVSSSHKPMPLTADQLQQISEQARQEGFQLGLKEGTEKGLLEGQKTGEKAGHQKAYMEAKKEIEALQAQLKSCAERLFEPMQKQERLIENTLVEICMSVSKAMIQSEIHANPKLLLTLIHQCVHSLPNASKQIQIKLNADDAELIQRLVPDASGWMLEVDEAMASGGVLVISDCSEIDFSVEQRLQTYLSKIDDFSADENSLHDVFDYASPEAEASSEQTDANTASTLDEPSPASVDSKIAEDGDEPA